jgi:hypothetical protein
MRRNYITPEYKQVEVEGTFNMEEQKGIYGSKMMDIEDEIVLDDRDIVYYQNAINEQIDEIQENLLAPIIYSISDDKEASHVLKIDESQTDFERQKNTKWIIEINIRDILINYIFSRIKEVRTFEGIQNSSTRNNSIDTAIRKYIEVNLLSRYEYQTIDLYIKYNQLTGGAFLRYQNNWNITIAEAQNKLSKVEVELNFDKSKLIGRFTQEKASTDFNFDYYFDIKYVKA